MAHSSRTWTGARTPQGKKRVRQAESRNAVLQPRRSAAKTRVRTAVAVASLGDAAATQTALVAALSALDRAAKVGAIHPNAAARRKSRLTIKVNSALAGGELVTTAKVARQTSKAAAAKAAKARIAAGKATKAKGEQTAAGKARAALSRSSRETAAVAAAAAAAKAAATPATGKASTSKTSTAKSSAAKAPAAQGTGRPQGTGRQGCRTGCQARRHQAGGSKAGCQGAGQGRRQARRDQVGSSEAGCQGPGEGSRQARREAQDHQELIPARTSRLSTPPDRPGAHHLGSRHARTNLVPRARTRRSAPKSAGGRDPSPSGLRRAHESEPIRAAPGRRTRSWLGSCAWRLTQTPNGPTVRLVEGSDQLRTDVAVETCGTHACQARSGAIRPSTVVPAWSGASSRSKPAGLMRVAQSRAIRPRRQTLTEGYAAALTAATPGFRTERKPAATSAPPVVSSTRMTPPLSCSRRAAAPNEGPSMMPAAASWSFSPSCT